MDRTTSLKFIFMWTWGIKSVTTLTSQPMFYFELLGHERKKQKTFSLQCIYYRLQLSTKQFVHQITQVQAAAASIFHFVRIIRRPQQTGWPLCSPRPGDHEGGIRWNVDSLADPQRANANNSEDRGLRKIPKVTAWHKTNRDDSRTSSCPVTAGWWMTQRFYRACGLFLLRTRALFLFFDKPINIKARGEFFKMKYGLFVIFVAVMLIVDENYLR